MLLFVCLWLVIKSTFFTSQLPLLAGINATEVMIYVYFTVLYILAWKFDVKSDSWVFIEQSIKYFLQPCQCSSMANGYWWTFWFAVVILDLVFPWSLTIHLWTDTAVWTICWFSRLVSHSVFIRSSQCAIHACLRDYQGLLADKRDFLGGNRWW